MGVQAQNNPLLQVKGLNVVLQEFSPGRILPGFVSPRLTLDLVYKPVCYNEYMLCKECM